MLKAVEHPFIEISINLYINTETLLEVPLGFVFTSLLVKKVTGTIRAQEIFVAEGWLAVGVRCLRSHYTTESADWCTSERTRPLYCLCMHLLVY